MQNDYTADSITVLEGLEPVRKRPGMYVGDVRDGTALHHLVWEVVGNSIDQHLARRARHLRVDVDERWITVEDDGPGIPIDRTPSGRSALERVFTTLHPGATWDGHFPHVHIAPSLKGVGVAVVNALSARMEVESRRRGTLHRIAFERGKVTQPLESCGRTSKTGTRVRFQPDPEIFGCTRLDCSRIEARLRELAWLHPLLDLSWQGALLPGREGLTGWVRELAGATRLHEPVLAVTGLHGDVWVDLALAWRDSSVRSVDLRTFVNASPVGSGTHVNGLWQGLARALGGRAGPVRELLEPDMIGIVHVCLLDPRFGSPTRDLLENPEAAQAICAVVSEAIRRLSYTSSELATSLRRRLRLESKS
jgi:DNA gyrase subunit B